MALLANCWFIIEYILIPDGFRKWFCLSVFVNPFFLFFCQFFLRIKVLGYWISSVLFYPLRFVWFLSLWVFRFSINYLICKFSGARSNSLEISQEFVSCEDNETHHPVQSIVLYHFHSVSQILNETVKGDERLQPAVEVDCIKEMIVSNSDLHHTEELKPEIHDEKEDMDLDEDRNSLSSLPFSEEEPLSGSESLILESNQVENQSGDIVIDPFYEKYAERMRWFDILNYERTCGIGAIFNKQQGSCSLAATEPTALFLPLMAQCKISRRKLLRSIEGDLEMVYVGQTCLCWEALHHQYRKVEALASSGAQNFIFYAHVAENFQNFQILLERFMEDERTKGKRYWNYVQGRFSFKSLLQVPEFSGYLEEHTEGFKGQSTTVVREVLKAIEKCIAAFWDFVQTDSTESWWKLKIFLSTYPPVEDPKDLKLLAELKKELQRKQLLMKDLQGKKRCWLKRSDHHHSREHHRREMLFSMMDMKLVARVLKMSLISTPQLQWCQEKLRNIEFKEGRVIRTCSNLSFPT